MRHRLRGRHLGRSSSHRHALMRNMARCLILTCDQEAAGAAKANGRIQTTLAKAKEVRPFVEKLVTTAVKAKKCRDDADQIACPLAVVTNTKHGVRPRPVRLGSKLKASTFIIVADCSMCCAATMWWFCCSISSHRDSRIDRVDTLAWFTSRSVVWAMRPNSRTLNLSVSRRV